MYKLVIFDFDGTIFDTYDAIEHSILLTFETLLPGFTPPPDEVRRLVSTGAPPGNTFRSLHPGVTTFDEDYWVKKYRELYAVHGQQRAKPFPGAEQVLNSLRARDIPIVIISNKGVEALKSALAKTGLLGYFPQPFILGDGVPGVTRKPDPSSFTDVMLPRLNELYGEKEGEVLMVGDTRTDIQFAQNIKAKVCWCRYGQGDSEECSRLNPDFTIDSVIDLLDIVGISKTE
ncbi:haloacid dehalogenase-like hydrolase [Aspergillus steynii IBT 23096]|uniref:Haloacid dehalogenase-like hydrolase n=1 Tax=Aspergillus steynii IBT 23096 TaxID=1392250 RepID=A0A2I2GEK8_9EURO|nr:haloacid dehalogenase-like hydrolase [Aspergillus steynii IBT 23096]PLB51325.1 haloacid dehalogenase-like hydrolase [Aspergillus steynii IBT 23096]